MHLTPIVIDANNMIIASLFVSVYVIFQSLCFQTDVADALRHKLTVGPVDLETVDQQHVCKWYFDEIGKKQVYRCCSGFYFNGSQCIECPEDTYGYGCGGSCQQCQSHEQCDSVYGCQCLHNNWTDNCQEPCKQTSCEENKYCDRRTGECSCAPGMFGTSCRYDCACYNHATCQKHTGECICETGWIGDTCTDCDESGVYPNGRKFCTDRCLHCFNGELCNINVSGDCDCTPGWTGNKCNVSIPVTCGSRFNSDICREHSDCDEPYICNVENCTCDRCIKGYRGEQCNMPCETGKYGYGCELSCSSVCENEACNHVTGKCKTCPIGYHGENCDVTCLAGYYGYNCQEKCQCSENMACNHRVGCIREKDSTTPMSYSTSRSQKSEVTEHQHQVTNGPNSTTKQIRDSENRTNGELDDIAEDHLPWIIGVCVFLVVLVIVNVIICIVCCRRRKGTVNKRNVRYENVGAAAERTDNLAMFVSTNDYELADVGTPGTTILTNDRHPTNLQNGDVESIGDEGNRNRGIPEYTQVDKTRKKKKMTAVHPQYSEVILNGETSTAQSQNAPGEDVYYHTLEEVDNKQTSFTGARGLSGGPHSGEGVSGSDGGTDEEVDYNVVDRTGKSYKPPINGNEPVNYERLGRGKEDVSTYEDTDYNKLNFGPERLASNQESDYSSYQH